MDYHGIGAFVNAAKRPLGLLGDVLVAEYLANATDLREKKHCQAQLHTYRSTADWEAGFSHSRTMLAIVRRCYLTWRMDGPGLIAELAEKPGGRCARRLGRGRCRGVSHRFAAYPFCRRHHMV